MENQTIQELIAAAHLASCDLLPNGRGDQVVRRITSDSREVQPGDCFVAVPGTAVDGHEYVSKAVSAGATAVVVEHDVDVPDNVTKIKVPDCRKAIARLSVAIHHIDRVETGRKLHMIGITGTNGKSTTASLLQGILQHDGHPTALFGTIEYDVLCRKIPAPLTTPDPVMLCEHLAEARDAGATYAVMEVSSHALSQSRCEGLDFDAAVFTNISGDHLDYHESMENYIRAKKILFDNLASDSCAIINADDPISGTMVADCSANIKRYGLIDTEANAFASLPHHSWDGTTFDVTGSLGPIWRMRTPLLGPHNTMNALAAIATARVLGIRPEAIRDGLAATTRVHGRLERIDPEGTPYQVVIDYAHTDGALDAALSALRPLAKGRLICVFGCGGDRDRSKRPRMGAVVGRWADIAVVTSDNPRSEDPGEIIDEILPGIWGQEECEVEVEADRADAIAMAIDMARDEDTILIAGKGHEDYQVLPTGKIHFDDAEVARQCIRERQERYS